MSEPLPTISRAGPSTPASKKRRNISADTVARRSGRGRRTHTLVFPSPPTLWQCEGERTEMKPNIMTSTRKGRGKKNGEGQRRRRGKLESAEQNKKSAKSGNKRLTLGSDPLPRPHPSILYKRNTFADTHHMELPVFPRALKWQDNGTDKASFAPCRLLSSDRSEFAFFQGHLATR
mgnify:CR=1 FL=1